MTAVVVVPVTSKFRSAKSTAGGEYRSVAPGLSLTDCTASSHESALSERPRFDWLPNPFEEGFGKHFRQRRGGMIVSYALKEAPTG